MGCSSVCPEGYVLPIRRKFDIFDPERLLAWLSLGEFSLGLIQGVKFRVKEVNLAFIVAYDNNIISGLLPIQASHFFLHFEDMSLLESTDIKDTQRAVITTCYESGLIW